MHILHLFFPAQSYIYILIPHIPLQAFYNHASHLAFSCGLKGNLVGLLKELKFDHNEMECSTHVAKCSTLCRLPQGESEKLTKRLVEMYV